jgi:hypothetical protein
VERLAGPGIELKPGGAPSPPTPRRSAVKNPGLSIPETKGLSGARPNFRGRRPG